MKEKEKNVMEITIKVEGEKWQKAIDKAYDKASKKAKIDGFRAGKAPKEVFLKKYGIESLYMDAADLSLEDAYAEMLKKAKDVTIVAQPEISLKSIDEKGIELLFTLTLKPEVKLGKYKDLKIKKDKVEVTAKEMEDAINELRNRYAESIIKDGKIVKNDIAVIDFEGSIDKVPFDGGKGENYSLTIGSNTFIPGFEDQLIGLKAGDEKDVTVTFPKDYHSEDLKGKEAVFKVKVKEVKETKIPELDKAFFADLAMDKVDSKESLEKELKETIKARKEMEAENKYTDDLLEAAAKNIKVNIPDAMIHDEIHRMMHQYEENLKMQGLTLDLFYKYTNSNAEALEAQMHPEAEKRVTFRLMLEEIIKLEKLEVSDDEVEKEATTLADKYSMKKDDFLKEFGGLEMIKYDLEMRKALEVLKG